MRNSKTSSSKFGVAKPMLSARPVAGPRSVPTDSQPPADTFFQARPEPALDDTARQHMIAEAAYFRAEHRGFEVGHELEDWLAAEAEIVGYSLRLGVSAPSARPAI